MNVEHPTLNFEHQIKGQKYMVDQSLVDRAFCAERCNAWMAKTNRCGTFMAPDYRKNMCMWEAPKRKTVAV